MIHGSNWRGTYAPPRISDPRTTYWTNASQHPSSPLSGNVFSPESSSKDVYEKIAKPVVQQFFEGFNGMPIVSTSLSLEPSEVVWEQRKATGRVLGPGFNNAEER